MANAFMPQLFWANAFQTAVFFIYRLPSPVTRHVSPYFLLFRKHPDYTYLRIFGTTCYPHLRPYNSHKLDLCSLPCLFIRYKPLHRGLITILYGIELPPNLFVFLFCPAKISLILEPSPFLLLVSLYYERAFLFILYSLAQGGMLAHSQIQLNVPAQQLLSVSYLCHQPPQLFQMIRM